MSALVVFLLSLSGFACLCVTMARHERDLLGRLLMSTQKRNLRVAGYGALGLAYAAALWAHGFGYGTVLWAGMLSVAAAAVVTFLAVRATRADQARRPTK